ncbi:hydrophobic protein [Lacticaseibacillus pabuli]|uniref:Hydrophobic protein n=1 Tax=Lacticaseibacillus pabuli TaxID=3025672 RepID=A0ABY7WWD5_9LACO|nr:hydrophobic protein [Lacticaseibacillus sp. KACC 23028]WDF83364.1 hydrophobic protein [Lacticaseibacillus sp. KACC 23028]
MLGIVLLILAVLFFTRGIFRAEPVSRFEALTIPVYSLVMGLLAIRQHMPSAVALTVTVVVGAIAGYLQSLSIQVEVTDKLDDRQRPVVKVRRGVMFLVGWLIIFAFGFLYAWHTGQHLDLIETAQEEITKDLLSFRNFTSGASWNVYLQSAVAGLVYILMLIRKEPKIGEAVAHGVRQRRRHR